VTEEFSLRRSLGLPLLVLYGLGTTVGAGVYALMGEVAAVSGLLAPLAFLLAALLAGVTALSFAELAQRFPRSAGEAAYVRAGLGSDRLALIVGLLVAAAGLVSASTIVNGFIGYLQDLLPIGRSLAIVLVVALLAGVTAWGIGQSVALAGLLTVVEVGGLLLVIWFGGGQIPQSGVSWRDLVPTLELSAWTGILAGSFLAFFAFIGFEDMVNVAEEVRDVKRTLPRAIVITFGVTIAIYLALAVVCVLSTPLQALAASSAPLALVVDEAGGPGRLISLIGVFATINGALIQMIMASRILYGLAAQGLLPAGLARVHPRRRTPVNATLIVAGIVLLLALVFGLVTLAAWTSAITLVVFALVNLSLWRLKRAPQASDTIWRLPRWLSGFGFVLTLGLLLAEGLRHLVG
jgi:amino acid transporter